MKKRNRDIRKESRSMEKSFLEVRRIAGEHESDTDGLDYVARRKREMLGGYDNEDQNIL